MIYFSKFNFFLVANYFVNPCEARTTLKHVYLLFHILYSYAQLWYSSFKLHIIPNWLACLFEDKSYTYRHNLESLKDVIFGYLRLCVDGSFIHFKDVELWICYDVIPLWRILNNIIFMNEEKGKGRRWRWKNTSTKSTFWSFHLVEMDLYHSL